MPDLFDFGFDDPAPAELKPAPAPPPAQAPAPKPCARKAWSLGHVCRVGKGDASFSDNGGLSWFCGGHAPADFFPPESRSRP